ncbi:MAG: glycosyltransferase family 2 protein [Alphaproteobacteria bacterium]|nr:glycosyltransferase family 2 protein [Alphaproteobacteria bacterium]
MLLAATMRNEGPYILEWVAHHLAIGFTDIVICTNDCVDESPALLDRLQELAPVTHLVNEVGADEKAQLAAYARIEKLPLLRDVVWAMVLDADEFFNIHVGTGSVSDLIDAVPQATAFLINWRIFGSAGHAEWRPGMITERFTKAAGLDDAVNLSFKTLFTKIDAYHCKLLPHQPRFPHETRRSELHYVNGGGMGLPSYFCDESRADFLQSEPDQVSWKLAQINHYNTRSSEDYLVKHQRGGGLNIRWDRDASWAAFNKNDDTDITITSKLPATKAVLSMLLTDDELRRRNQRCCELYRELIAALKHAQTTPRTILQPAVDDRRLWQNRLPSASR